MSIFVNELIIKLDGFNGDPGALISVKETTTGAQVTLLGPLAQAIAKLTKTND